MSGCFHSNNAFVIFLFMIWITGAVQGDILTYKANTRQLNLRCPEEKYTQGKVEFITLSREDGAGLLANWTPADQGLAIHERIRVLPPTPRFLLRAVLDHVSCCDVSSYTCTLLVNPHNQNSPPSYIRQTQQFTFQEEVYGPVLTVTPLQARYTEGDTITLTCTARLGTKANSILWETRLPGGKFQPAADKTDPSPTEQTSFVRANTSMTHLLTANDDNREWRCSLRETKHEAVFVVAVQCKDGTACSVSRQTTLPPTAETTTAAGKRTKGQVVDDDDSSDIAEMLPTSPTLLILVAVIAVLFTSMVISVVVMTVKIRKQLRKQQSPIYITPSSSDHTSYRPWPVITNQSRSLPQPPSEHASHTVNHFCDDNNDSDLHGKDDDDETALKFTNHCYIPPLGPSSSVYISMSAVPSLHECARPIGEWEGLVREERKRSVHSGRSESVYLNAEAVERGAWKANKNSSASHDSHVTLGNLKEWEAQGQP